VSATHQPRPAALPLPGGREGATVRLHPLLVAEMASPPGITDRPGGPLRTLRGLGLHVPRSRWELLPIPAFLVEHPGAGPILIDTGFHPSVATDPGPNMGRLAKALYDIRMAPEQGVRAQLAARGVDPVDVRVVVMTHLHYDHASGVGEFPRATFLVDPREWEAATAPRGFVRGYHPAHFDLPLDWRAVDHERAGAPHAGFARSVDLFGDGSVRLLSTPGHTLGHQSVLLRLGGGEALLVGDAAYDLRTIAGERMPLLIADERRFLSSLASVRHWVDAHPGALVVPGHDPLAWRALDAVYA